MFLEQSGTAEGPLLHRAVVILLRLDTPMHKERSLRITWLPADRTTMKRGAFLQRLGFTRTGISTAAVIILTWEECRDADQRNRRHSVTQIHH